MYSAVCTCIVLIALQCAHVYYTCIVLSAVCTCIVLIALLSGKVWKFRTPESGVQSVTAVHWRVEECCTVFMQDRVQCVLPQSDVQERCIVYRVVHGAQYAGVCPSGAGLVYSVHCTLCMRVHCLHSGGGGV